MIQFPGDSIHIGTEEEDSGHWKPATPPCIMKTKRVLQLRFSTDLSIYWALCPLYFPTEIPWTRRSSLFIHSRAQLLTRTLSLIKQKTEQNLAKTKTAYHYRKHFFFYNGKCLPGVNPRILVTCSSDPSDPAPLVMLRILLLIF